MLSKTTELPAVKNYLNAISGNPEFRDLYRIDRSKFDELNSNLTGWDWADHDGSCVLNALWLTADAREAQHALASISHLRALAWEDALKMIWRYTLPAGLLDPSGLGHGETARQQAHGQPCVVIEFAETGGFFVHADEGVHVFNRHEDSEIEGLFRYKRLPIPKEWLQEPARDLPGEQTA